MIDNFSNLHEAETIYLKAEIPLPCKELDAVLRDMGFKNEDETFYLDRKDVVREWQSKEIAMLEVYREKDRLEDLTSGIWNLLTVEFLLATVPRSCIPVFL